MVSNSVSLLLSYERRSETVQRPMRMLMLTRRMAAGSCRSWRGFRRNFWQKDKRERGGGNENANAPRLLRRITNFSVLSPLLPEGEQDLTVTELIMRFYNLPMHHWEAYQNYLVIGGYHA